ncbi:hypothetical protein TNIN_176411, partial [Trichonephila inaurata madagascariensis]
MKRRMSRIMQEIPRKRLDDTRRTGKSDDDNNDKALGIMESVMASFLREHVRNIKDLRHSSKKDSTDQCEMVERIVSGIYEDEPSAKNKNNGGKLQNGLLTKNRGGNVSENKADNFQSQSNTVGDLETKAGPGHGSKSNLNSNLRLSKKNSIGKSKVFETVAAKSKVEHSSVRTSKKIGGNKKDEGILQNQLLTKGTEENDASENKGNSFQSQSNTVDQETKTGPSHESKSNLETENSS